MTHEKRITSISSALKMRVAKAMKNRHETLNSLLAKLQKDEQFIQIGDPSLDSRYILAEAECDHQVWTAVQAYRHSGGSVFDKEIPLRQAAMPNRSSPAAAMLASFEFAGIPAEAARIEMDVSGSGKCYFDERYKIEVLHFLSNYYNQSEAAFEIKDLDPGRWVVPGLFNDAQAVNYLRQDEPGASPFMEYIQ